MPMNPRTLRPGSTFTPRSISGLALWLDAADSQTLYTTDSGPVTAVSSPLEITANPCLCWYDASDASSVTQSGGLVTQWSDKSGNARHATASGSLRPTHGGSQNGRTVMQFTGTQAMTITGNFLQTDNVTMFAVAMKNTDHFGGIITSAPINPEDSPILAFWTAGNAAFINRRVTIQQAVATGVYIIVAGQSVGTNQVAHFNGVRGLDISTGTPTNTTNTITKIGVLRTSSTADLNGNIAEIVCYSGNLSTTDRARVEAYLAAKWGISGVHAPATATNDPVGAWLDKSGNARHATQATAASRPTVSATALNGRRQLGLVSQHLRGPSTTWSGSASIYWVGRTGQATNGAFVFSDGTFGQSDAFHAGWLFTAGVGAYGNGWQSGNAPRAESPSAWRNADVVAGVTLSSTEAIARVNGATTNTSAALTGSLSQSAAAQFSIGQDTPVGWTNFNGSLAELLIYQPALSASQRARLERYLAAKWGVTLAPQVSNADAQDWVNRVYANGGTVSATTAEAVNQFCNAIDAAGIRDRFYRLNLFAGNSDANLAAVRTPLFRGPSLGGTQYGNAIDTNVNFVAGDYAETGASGGLTGNGTSKSLRHGVLWSAVPDINNVHMSVYLRTPGNTGSLLGGYWFHSTDAAQRTSWELFSGTAATGSTAGSSFPTGSLPALLTASRIGATSSFLYRNATASAEVLTSTSVGRAIESTVFARNLIVGAPPAGSSYAETLHSSSAVGGYSLGAGMSASQVAAYNTAMQAFQVALRRDRPSSDPMFASVTSEDAKLWIDNVYTNGGTVSATTANAVNQFCVDIENAGIRDRFYRLNLFCGNSDASLAAVRTPLFRGPSLTGTQYGGTTDTNVNFVQGDYAETGASGGLTGNGSSKYLDTGLTANTMPFGNLHLSAYVTRATQSGTYRVLLHARSLANLEEAGLWSNQTPAASVAYFSEEATATGFVPGTTNNPNGFVLGSSTQAADRRFYRNGSQEGSTVTSALTMTRYPAIALRLLSNNFAGTFSDARVAAYSAGLGMSAAQVAAFSTAMQTFQVALGRQV